MNQRYLNYCRMEGLDPDAMLARDVERWPGGKMCGFIVWMSQRWQEWRALRGVGRWSPLTMAQHDDFDAWLNAYPVSPLS